ncbi:MAG: hypothetical protein HW389_3886 [Bacteroidetes bacterium]|nr:hypothetical protein [Bacteroidota bacterium]
MRTIIILSALSVSLSLHVFSQTRISFGAWSSSTANFVVTDSAGRRTGVDPRNSRPYEQWTWYKEIPNSTYGFESGDEGGPSTAVFEMSFMAPDGEGTYSIQLIGNVLGTFRFYVRLIPLSQSFQARQVRFTVDGSPIERDSVVTYLFTYHSAIGCL